MGKDYCAIPLCHNYSGKVGRFGKEVKLHSLPKNPSLRSAWIRAISRKNYRANRNTFVCSDHFPCGDGRTWKHTIPTLHLPQKLVTPLKPRNTKNSQSQDQAVNESVEQSISDDQNEDTETVSSANYAHIDHDHCYFSYTLEDTGCSYQTGKEVLGNEMDNLMACNVDQEEIDNQPCKQDDPEITMSKMNDQDVPFYTGLPNRHTFNSLLSTCLVHDGDNYLKKSRASKLSLENELLLTLMRLRLGLLLKDLAYRFHISESQTSRIFKTWIIFLHSALQSIVFMPEVFDHNTYVPECFQFFSNTRIILDCTEIFVETPSSLENKSKVYSNYKSHSTFKALVGINMVGAVVFVSKLYGGCTSDVQITRNSGLYEKLRSGEAVMADKGFLNIKSDLQRLGIKLYAPPMNTKGQLSKQEVILTRRIASARIHVERKMEQLKNFRILSGVLPLTLSATANEIFFVCTALTNFQPPLVK